VEEAARNRALPRSLDAWMKVKVVSVMYAWERHEVDDQLSLPLALLKLNVAASYSV